jgi:hypothetical protein
MKHLKTYESFNYDVYSLNEEEEILGFLKKVGSTIASAFSSVVNFFKKMFSKLFTFNVSAYKAKAEKLVEDVQKTEQWKKFIESMVGKLSSEQVANLESTVKTTQFSETECENMGEAVKSLTGAQEKVEEVTEKLRSGLITESRGYYLLREAQEQKEDAEKQLRQEIEKKMGKLQAGVFITGLSAFIVTTIGLLSGSFAVAVIGAGVLVAGLIAAAIAAVAIVAKGAKTGELPRGL